MIERGSDGWRGSGRRQSDAAQYRASRARAKRPADPNIVGLAVRIIDPQMEFAQAQELSRLIRDFAAQHKWTTAYLESAGDFGSGNLPFMVAARDRRSFDDAARARST